MGIGTGTLGLVGHYIDGIRKSLRQRRQAKALLKWQRSGRPAPPPHQVKQAILRKYASKFNTRVLVETGTFLGDMIEAMRDNFDKIFSIELSEEYYANIDNEKEEAEITRRHLIVDHEDEGLCGLISIIGGKLTTYRNLAEETVNFVFEKLDRTAPPCETGTRPMLGGGMKNINRYVRENGKKYER